MQVAYRSRKELAVIMSPRFIGVKCRVKQDTMQMDDPAKLCVDDLV